MVRCRIFLPPICAIVFVVAGFVCAQQSDEIRQRPVEIRSGETPAETPAPSETPKPKPKQNKGKTTASPTPKAKSSARATRSDEQDESETPHPSPHHHKKGVSAKARPSETPGDEETPKPKKSPTTGKVKKENAAEEQTPAAKAKTKAKKKAIGESASPSAAPRRAETPAETPTPRATASAARAVTTPKPTAPPAPAPTSGAGTSGGEEPEQLTIEKYGYEKPRTFWQRVFGGGRTSSSSSGAGYRYLTRSVRAEIDRAGADRRNPRWQLIVVHNSGTRQGNARVFDYYHRHVRHMQNGLAYHFVIGNGTSTGNGEIEVGDRWRRQINGGHVHSDYLNNIAIGICLVGDFNRDQPTRAQLDCCEELTRYLRQRCGKIDNHFPVVKPHREVNPPRWGTDCPGNVFPYAWFRRFRE